ncbi:hypothetical protein JW964_24005 [candidate division KSB1 bacterium]|nr:hypothetical protein [candidate division KSB1 bacterium]
MDIMTAEETILKGEAEFEGLMAPVWKQLFAACPRWINHPEVRKRLTPVMCKTQEIKSFWFGFVLRSSSFRRREWTAEQKKPNYSWM